MRGPLRAFYVGRESEEGQAIVLIAITLLAMLMIVGVAIDAGQVYSARRAMQEAADAAAYAGAVTLYQGGTQTQAFTAARTDATTNGYTNNPPDTLVTVVQPTTAPFNTIAYVQVTITRNVRTALVPAEAAITQVTVHAIAGAVNLNNQYAMIALDTGNTTNAFNGGTANITLTGGGVKVNSNAATAGTGSTGAWSITCTSTNPCGVDIVGGSGGSFPVASPGSPNYYNGVTTGTAVLADPFAGYPKPSTSGMTLNPAPFGPSNKTIGQGIYNGAAISGVSLCHGIYILKGNGMGGDITSDTTSTDPATGLTCDGRVLVFNTQSNYPSSGGTCATLTWSGNHAISSLQPPNSGIYKGLLLYQDSACTAAVSMGSSSFDFNVSGTIYIPNAAFTVSGGHPIINGGQIVAKTISLGAATVTVNFSATTSAQPTLPRLAQ